MVLIEKMWSYNHRAKICRQLSYLGQLYKFLILRPGYEKKMCEFFKNIDNDDITDIIRWDNFTFTKLALM